MADVKDFNYVINAKNALIDIYGVRHMSWMNMAIWVSKEPSELQDCRQISFNNILEV